MTNALEKGLCSLLLEKLRVMTTEKAIGGTRKTSAIKRNLPIICYRAMMQPMVQCSY